MAAPIRTNEAQSLSPIFEKPTRAEIIQYALITIQAFAFRAYHGSFRYSCSQAQLLERIKEYVSTAREAESESFDVPLNESQLVARRVAKIGEVHLRDILPAVRQYNLDVTISSFTNVFLTQIPEIRWIDSSSVQRITRYLLSSLFDEPAIIYTVQNVAYSYQKLQELYQKTTNFYETYARNLIASLQNQGTIANQIIMNQQDVHQLFEQIQQVMDFTISNHERLASLFLAQYHNSAVKQQAYHQQLQRFQLAPVNSPGKVLELK